MDFKNGKELLKRCAEAQLPISSVMKQREVDLTEASETEIAARMEKALQIMKDSAHLPLKEPVKSMGGLIGGEAAKLERSRQNQTAIGGAVLTKAITYAMAVLEVNASMGLIVAAPTAGSSGILPGLLLALQEEYELSDDRIINGLFSASAIGYLAMRNATVSGAMGGCQAEVGIASAMAAAAAVEIMGGTPEQCMHAASTALMNLLGLVCDPIAGLVESPCQSRNAVGVANALASAEIALAGIVQILPLDEMLEAFMSVGRRLPRELRETALGGCAATPTGCGFACTSQRGTHEK
ncbi:MAG: L-serine ammonia-lyase, iron-sulfur-dependent, subunit alpha [Hungatella sp.]